MYPVITLILATLLMMAPPVGGAHRIPLDGEWTVTLKGDSLPPVTRAEVTLPGTLDTNGMGFEVQPSGNTAQLSRRHTFTGPASWSRTVEIPQNEAGKRAILVLERTRPSRIRIDGIDAGSSSLISAPQRFDLTEWLTPGTHTLEVTTDNGTSIPKAVRDNSHACTESTQTNWNGIIGDIYLEFLNRSHFEGVRTVTDAAHRKVNVSGRVTEPDSRTAVTIRALDNQSSTLADGNGYFDITLQLPPATPLWSEWSPALLDIELTATGAHGDTLDTRTIRTGLRDFKTSGTQFTLNGDTTLLRGRHDACVWPLTAHVPMDLDSWRRYFDTLKMYGLNHVRFHSWCPPEACFRAADEAGVYLQPELPIWGEIDKDNPELLDFLNAEMEGIIAEYGHHPSFVMFAIGNELWGDTDIMLSFTDRARTLQPGLLTTRGSNIYLGWNGYLPGDDYYTACRAGGGEGFTGHARASFSFADADNGGIMNTVRDNGTHNFAEAVSRVPVPLISHETGQYQIYPDYSTIEKYTGVLRPDNLETWHKRGIESGLQDRFKKYARASGEWAARLYKADMEMELRTPGIGGFQLLDLQDYPGQGTALVGILDPFLDSKNLVTPQQWRQSCDSVTLLASLPAYCFTGGEKVTVPLSVADYSRSLPADLSLEWNLPFASGSNPVAPGRGLRAAGTIDLTLPEVKKPEKMSLDLRLGDFTNRYDLWVYPRQKGNAKRADVTQSLQEALQWLDQGRNVVLLPDPATVAEATIGPLFQTDYWNYRMFRTICERVNKPVSPGTLGLLINDTHPVFEWFPTSGHTDWQWYAAATASRPLVIDRLPATVHPIVEPIDNPERAYRLAFMLEMNVGKGKLLLIMADLDRLTRYPEGEWLLESARRYAAGKKFKPALTLTPTQLEALLTRPSLKRRIESVNNPSY